VYGVHSMMCVWITRDGLYNMLFIVWVVRIFMICTFVLHSLHNGRVNSPNLLYALDLNTPRYRTRSSEFHRIGFHRTNYEVYAPMSAGVDWP
jgi:hypothetical protein